MLEVNSVRCKLFINAAKFLFFFLGTWHSESIYITHQKVTINMISYNSTSFVTAK